MTIEIANNIDDAYRVCNPDLPLKADDTRYVDSENNSEHSCP